MCTKTLLREGSGGGGENVQQQQQQKYINSTTIAIQICIQYPSRGILSGQII